MRQRTTRYVPPARTRGCRERSPFGRANRLVHGNRHWEKVRSRGQVSESAPAFWLRSSSCCSISALGAEASYLPMERWARRPPLRCRKTARRNPLMPNSVGPVTRAQRDRRWLSCATCERCLGRIGGRESSGVGPPRFTLLPHSRSMSFIISSVMGMTSKSLKNISQSVPPCICSPSLPVFSHASSMRSDVQNPFSV